LDWERHGFLFWHEQSSFNYDERGYCPGSRFYSKSNANTNSDGDANPNRDAKSNRYANSDTESH
jgi:hypothetical protein